MSFGHIEEHRVVGFPGSRFAGEAEGCGRVEHGVDRAAHELAASGCTAPLLVLTGLPGPLVRRALRGLPRAEVLAKPVSLAALGRAVRAALDADSGEGSSGAAGGEALPRGT